MEWKINTAATTWGITLTEAKDHLRIFDTSWDDQITMYLKIANEQLFSEANVMAGDAVIEGYTDSLDDLYLYFGEVASVTSIKYYDSSNVQQTMVAGTDYVLYNDTYPVKIEFLTSPALYDRPDAVEVILQMGYTTTPEAVKGALLLMVKDLFDVADSNYKEMDGTRFSKNTKLAISLISKRNEI